jgi:hypothetical protein
VEYVESLKEGVIYGIILAATTYTVVQIMGYSHKSLAVVLYIQIMAGIILTAKSRIATPLKPYLDRLVVVAEGEEMKLKKLLTGEEYRVKGEVEKL